MTATIDFGIKPALNFLMKDYRWNVLTVMFLHANIRNRCYVSMDTIAEMATNGNRTKANRAKKWLEQHKAFELVPLDKRVDEEEELTARQLVYQLTGKIVTCLNSECDCKADGKEYLYLYFGKTNRLNGQTIPPDNRLDGETINRLNGQTQDSITIQTLSISSEVSKKKIQKPAKKKSLTELEQLQIRLRTVVEIMPAILSKMERGYDLTKDTPEGYMTEALLKKYISLAEQLAFLKMTAQQFLGLWGEIEPEYRRKDWTIGVVTIEEKAPSYMARQRTKGEKQLPPLTVVTSPQPIQPTEPELTSEQRIAMAEQAKIDYLTVRPAVGE